MKACGGYQRPKRCKDSGQGLSCCSRLVKQWPTDWRWLGEIGPTARDLGWERGNLLASSLAENCVTT
jgi:hypothetical protein